MRGPKCNELRTSNAQRALQQPVRDILAPISLALTIISRLTDRIQFCSRHFAHKLHVLHRLTEVDLQTQTSSIIQSNSKPKRKLEKCLARFDAQREPNYRRSTRCTSGSVDLSSPTKPFAKGNGELLDISLVTGHRSVSQPAVCQSCMKSKKDKASQVRSSTRRCPQFSSFWHEENDSPRYVQVHTIYANSPHLLVVVWQRMFSQGTATILLYSSRVPERQLWSFVRLLAAFIKKWLLSEPFHRFV